MKLLIFSAALWAVSEVSSSGVTVGITPFSHPVHTQYHSQDVFGQYAYGYATPTSAKSETKTADGVTQGGYSYIDSHGILQTVQYISDPVHGFRVAATNLPQDVPEVAYAKAQHLAAVEATKAEHALIAANQVHYTNPIVYPAAAVQQVPLVSVPAPVHDLPEVIRARAEHLAAFEAIKARDLSIAAQHAVISPVPAQLSSAVVPVTTQAVHAAPAVSYAQNAHYSYVPAVPSYQHLPASSQYHAQDALGQYSYGYVGPLSSKSEAKTADGITRGGYSYIDANGIVQTVNYISDPVNGFRVAATNLPVGPAEVATAPVAVAQITGPTAGVAAVATAPVSVSSSSSTVIHSHAPVVETIAAPVAVSAPVAAAIPASYSTTTIHAGAPVAAAAPVAYSSASYHAAAPLAVAAPVARVAAAAPVAYSSASYHAAAPIAVAAPVAAAAPVAYSSASYHAAAPLAVAAPVARVAAAAPVAYSDARYHAAAPVAVAAPVARVAAAAPVAVGAHIAANVIKTGPEPGWYQQEVVF